MRPNRNLLALAAVLVAAQTPLPAEAQAAEARARLGALSYEIYDARPDDGVVPSAIFLDEANAWRTYIYFDGYTTDSNGSYGQDVVFRDQMLYAPHVMPLVLQGASVGVNQVEGFGVAGGAWADDTVLVGAQGQAWAPGLSFDAHAGLSTSATGTLSPTFYNLVLGPGTGVRITGYGIAEAWLSTSGQQAIATTELYTSFSPRAADGSFQSALRRDDYDGVQVWLDQYDLAFQLPHDTLVKRTDERWLWLMHENLSDAEEIGRVRFASYAYGSALAPVPEPSAWAVLLLGMAGLSIVLRRRSFASGH